MQTSSLLLKHALRISFPIVLRILIVVLGFILATILFSGHYSFVVHKTAAQIPPAWQGFPLYRRPGVTLIPDGLRHYPVISVPIGGPYDGDIEFEIVIGPPDLRTLCPQERVCL